MNLLEIEDLHVQVEDVKIINGLNLQIKKGEVHAVMGPNGSGKSTFSKTLAGHPAYKITKGNIKIDEDNVSGEVIVNMESLLVEDLQGEWGKKLEGHLKSPDFFSVVKFKESSLKTVSSIKISDNNFKVVGILTIKDISHSITFDLSINENILSANLVFDRSKYDVRFRSGSFFENLGDKLILDDIELEVILQLN